MWKNGSTAMTRSVSLVWNRPANWHMFATRFRCVSITPLGSPVLPRELIRGQQRAGGRVDAAERRHGVEGHRILGQIRRVVGEDVAPPKAPLGEAGGDPAHRLAQPSCPGGMFIASPAPNSISSPSSIRTLSRPETQ